MTLQIPLTELFKSEDLRKAFRFLNNFAVLNYLWNYMDLVFYKFWKEQFEGVLFALKRTPAYIFKNPDGKWCLNVSSVIKYITFKNNGET